MIKLFYRYGVAKDKKILQEDVDAYYGISFSAHTACYYQKSIIIFLGGIKKPYFIDPVTYRFAIDLSKIFRKEGGIKKSFVKLLDLYGDKLRKIIINENRSLRASDFYKNESFLNHDFINELCEQVISFQEKFNTEVLQAELFTKLMMYADKKIPEPEKPDFLIPPYFYAWDTNDPWYNISKHCAEASRKFTSLPISPIICISKSVLLDDQQLNKIVADYDSFDQIILWISDFDSTQEGTAFLRGFLNLITKFQEKDKEVLSLYGNYFDLILSKKGLSGFSTGLGYGESKDVASSTGGPLPTRYYLHFLKYYAPPLDAQGYLTKHGELSCHCKICNSSIAIADLSDIDAKKHFLYSRKNELIHIESKQLNEICAELINIFQKLDGSELDIYGFRSIHLYNWADVLS